MLTHELCAAGHCCRKARYGKRDADSLRSTASISPPKADEERAPLRDASLFRSEEVPRYVRLLVPLLLSVNTLFFLSGHISLGASVDVTLNLFGEKFAIPGVQASRDVSLNANAFTGHPFPRDAATA